MNVERDFPKKDYTNKKINKLFVEKFLKYRIKPYGRIPIWLCKCDCGNYKEVTTCALSNGQHSCGCSLEYYRKNHTNARKLPKGEAQFNNLYTSYQYRAKKKRIIFKISKEDFRKLTSNNCFYCNSKPSTFCGKNKIKSNGYYVHNGLDRINSSKGYIKTNVVTCCEICNKAKRDLTLEKFTEWIKMLTIHANKINFNYTTTYKN